MAVDLDLAKKRWTQAEDADQKQRQREKDDLSFYEGVGQWPDEIKTLRKGQTALAGMPAVPARPCLTINKVKDPVRHVINELVQADFGFSVIPAEDIADQPIDENEIELREGLIRRIQRESDAQEALFWAASRAIICGRGYLSIMTRDLPGATFDQEIYFNKIFNQFSVSLDPAHEHPTAADIDWGFIGTNVPWNIYKAENATTSDGTKNHVIDADDNEWRAYGDDAPGWFSGTGDTRSVRVVEYWFTERTAVEYVLLDDGSVVEAKTIDKDALKAIPSDRKKRDVQKTIMFAKIDGCNVFQETEWPGKYIPIVKFVGEEIHTFDGERREEGMVRPARDSQQAFNYMISAAVETIGLAPKAPIIGYAGQFEGFEQIWDMANVRTIGRLEANAVTDATSGTILPLPQRQVAEPPIQAMAQMIREFSVAIKDTTGIPDPTLGNVDPNARSGKAIRAMLEQALRGTSNYMNNAIKSTQRAGVIVNDLLEPIYSRKGRRVRIMSGTNDTRTVMLHQPFIQQPNGPPQAFDPTQHQTDQRQTYTLTKDGAGNVSVKVSKHYDTKREQESAQLAELIQADPQLMLWFGDLFFKNQDSPGHQELAERAKAMLAPPIQKLLAQGQPADPEKQQMQATIEQMGKALQEAEADKGAKIQSAQIKAASDAQQTDSDNAVKLEIARLNAGVQLEIADLKASSAQVIESNKLIAQQLQSIIDASHEQRLSDKQRAHEESLAGLEHGHTAALTEREHAHTMDETTLAAALTPAPVEAGA